VNKSLRDFSDRYTSTLQRFFAHQEEASLEQAYELGRKALTEKIGLMEMVSLHQKALAESLSQPLTDGERRSLILAADGFFRECVGPFEMIQRGFQETIAELRKMNEVLEKRVIERTESMRRTAESLRAIFQASPLAVIELDLDGHVLMWNPAAECLFGWKQKEILNLPNPIIPEDQQEEALSLRERALRGESFAMLETVRQKKNGSLISVSYSLAPLYDSGRKAIGVVMVIADITERKRMEEALKRSESHFRSLFEGLTEGFALHEIICDEVGVPCDYRILEVNPAFEGLTGLKRENLIGRTVLEVLPGTEPVWIEKYGQVALTGKSVHFESYSAVLKRYYEIFAYSPAPRQFGVLFMDVTGRKREEEDRKRLQEAIREERDKLSALVNSIPDEVWFADTRKKFTLANPTALQEFGFDTAGGGIEVEKFVANLEIYHPDGSLRRVEESQSLRSLRGEVIRNEEEIIRSPARGELRHRQVSSTPVRNADGTIIGSVSVVRDITEFKRLEQELRKSRDELELRVQQRTEELAKSQERLQHLASQLLLAQEKERRRIASELHDGLLSEMAAMKFLFEAKLMLLKKGQLADTNELDRITDIMQKVIRDARGIMNNLRPSILDEIGLIPTIGWLSREYWKTYSHIQIRRQVEVVETDIPEVLKIVIFRVLQEALNNFVKHARGDLVDLSLWKSGNTLHLRIRDNGQGYDMGKVQKGVGLGSMRERVESSLGSFQIESAAGKGTTIQASWVLPENR